MKPKIKKIVRNGETIVVDSNSIKSGFILNYGGVLYKKIRFGVWRKQRSKENGA